jgi:precorrin-6B methylase 2
MMNIESVMRLSAPIQTLAALGAELQLRQRHLDGDPRVRACLRDVLNAANPEWLKDADSSQTAIALSLVQTIFRQALELLENPDREPGWTHRDPLILQSQGQVSRMIIRGIESIAARILELKAALQRPGAFLDVGTGVGWLAIEAAQTWPALQVVGIDPWEPALTLARDNLAKSDVAGRVALRLERAQELAEIEHFTLAWVPGPFISAAVADQVLERVHHALRPAGWIIFGLHGEAADPLEQALARLRIVRSGGYPWKQSEVVERLRLLGFTHIEASLGAPSVGLVVARKKTA